MSYSDYFQNLKSYYFIGAVCNVISMMGWLYIAKTITDKDVKLLYGVYWDALIVVAFIGIPVLFHGARLSGTNLAGAILILAGIVISKF